MLALFLYVVTLLKQKFCELRMKQMEELSSCISFNSRKI